MFVTAFNGNFQFQMRSIEIYWLELFVLLLLFDRPHRVHNEFVQTVHIFPSLRILFCCVVVLLLYTKID